MVKANVLLIRTYLTIEEGNSVLLTMRQFVSARASFAAFATFKVDGGGISKFFSVTQLLDLSKNFTPSSAKETRSTCLNFSAHYCMKKDLKFVIISFLSSTVLPQLLPQFIR